MNNNNKSSLPPIQYTKLTPDDITMHKKIYTYLLMKDAKRTLGEKGQELHKAMQLFYEAFK